MRPVKAACQISDGCVPGKRCVRTRLATGNVVSDRRVSWLAMGVTVSD